MKSRTASDWVSVSTVPGWISSGSDRDGTRQVLSPANIERLAARREHGHIGATLEDRRRHLGTCRQQVFAVVEQHERLLRREIVERGVQCARAGQGTDADRFGQRGTDQVWVVQRRQVHPPGPVREEIERVRGRLQGQPGLAAAARAGQRHQPCGLEELFQVDELGVAPDEGAEPHRQVVRQRVEGTYGCIQRRLLSSLCAATV